MYQFSKRFNVDGRQRRENGGVNMKLLLRFQWNENGGFCKRISVDVANMMNKYVLGNFSILFLFVPKKKKWISSVLCWCERKPLPSVSVSRARLSPSLKPFNAIVIFDMWYF